MGRIQAYSTRNLTAVKEISQKNTSTVRLKFITAKEFMDTVKIKRTKFDQLVQANKINIIKKARNIYVQVSEVHRYFNDESIK